MNNEELLREKLQEILETENYEALSDYQQIHQWNSLKDCDRHLFSKLLIKKGELELTNRDVNFSKSFELADLVCPENAHNYYLKGLAFSKQTENAKCLLSAVECFEKALELEPYFFEAHLALGDALLLNGEFQSNQAFFQSAQNVFEVAYSLIEPKYAAYEPTLLWKWGLSFFYLGMASEEPIDFCQAIQKFRLAKSLGLNKSDFFQNFAESLMELGDLLKQKELCQEAVEYYHLALSNDPENYDRWFMLASCYEKLYSMTKDNSYFELATSSFEVYLKGGNPSFFAFVKWGKLLLSASKIHKNSDLAYFAIEKFQNAYEMDSDHPALLGLMSEAEMIYGVHTEKLEYLRSAETKILKSLKNLPDNPHILGLYGSCLNELGRYFGEISYYEQAVIKFKEGLSINEKDSHLLIGLASSYFILGDCSASEEMYEKALNCYQKISELNQVHPSHFFNDWAVTYMKLSEITNEKIYLEKSIQKFEEALSLENEKFQDSEWLYNYGCALDFMGDFTEDSNFYEKAVAVLTKSLQIDPEHVHARYNLAVALTHLGEATSDLDVLQEAVNNFKILISHDVEDDMAWNYCGLALLNIAELVHESAIPDRSRVYYDEAEQKFMQAIALGCTHSYYNLACLYSIQHNYPVAMHYLEKAESAGTLPELDDMLHDEWLENLVETPGFRHFASYIHEKQEGQEEEI